MPRNNEDDNQINFPDLYKLKICSSPETPYIFGVHKGMLTLYDFNNDIRNGINFDWIKQWNYHRIKNYSLKKEPFAKALGIKGNKISTIWDLTFGTGKDAILLLHFGARVVGFERNKTVSILIKDALRASQKDDVLNKVLNEKLTFIAEDPSRSHNLEVFNNTPHAIYIDPMYSPKTKTAKSRKEMEIFKHIVGPDNDSVELFNFAIKHSSRVVVKRSLHAEELVRNPDIIYKGKSTRYDVYLKKIKVNKHD
ncbi:MAG: class I SAM-dependent methyltransferase [Deltaproteobacteria bacterium]|nr:class I SAM-dependent methyltransferase [Deltaproteobacteria bacterium]